MSDSVRPPDRARPSILATLGVRSPDTCKPLNEEVDEDSCPAFGFLRGVKERGLAIEFRLRDGNREFFPYSWLGPVRYNPSVGILLRFTGDTITLVLLRGSNFDTAVRQDSINLTDRGLQRHRITFVREMDQDEVRKVGEGGPTIDGIDIAEFETQEEVQAWIKKVAPVFVRQPREG